jgi:hypothetical protein
MTRRVVPGIVLTSAYLHRQKRMRHPVDAASLVTERHGGHRHSQWISLWPLVGSRAVGALNASSHLSVRLHDAVHVQLYLAEHVDSYADNLCWAGR